MPTPNPSAVFVLSPPRSGTTLLRTMLGSHPALFAPPELQLLNFDTLRERSRVVSNGRDDFWLQGSVRALMALHECDAERVYACMERFERADWSVQRFYRHLQDQLHGRTLVDKTPMYALDLATAQLVAAGEQVAFLALLESRLRMTRLRLDLTTDEDLLRVFLRDYELADDTGSGRPERALAQARRRGVVPAQLSTDEFVGRDAELPINRFPLASLSGTDEGAHLGSPSPICGTRAPQVTYETGQRGHTPCGEGQAARRTRRPPLMIGVATKLATYPAWPMNVYRWRARWHAQRPLGGLVGSGPFDARLGSKLVDAALFNPGLA